ncbi:hypothetical protein [Verminephrobacter eiseniae]|uniref:hypothetical protein n=1 Tax=Verminephrobacter eiseniae TaxID=364317 RepID=UPI002238F627|nr:hypothetical protein [Verminephrobacter eiseniae]
MARIENNKFFFSAQQPSQCSRYLLAHCVMAGSETSLAIHACNLHAILRVGAAGKPCMQLCRERRFLRQPAGTFPTPWKWCGNTCGIPLSSGGFRRFLP